MATLKNAERARDLHSERLRSMGAHAIAVEPVRRRHKRTFAVIAYFERKPASVPKVIAIRAGTKVVDVELVAKTSPPFRPEG